MCRSLRPWLLIASLVVLGFAPLLAQSDAAPSPPTAQPSAMVYPTKGRFGRPYPSQTFYCQYVGLANDASGKYPL